MFPYTYSFSWQHCPSDYAPDACEHICVKQSCLDWIFSYIGATAFFFFLFVFSDNTWLCSSIYPSSPSLHLFQSELMSVEGLKVLFAIFYSLFSSVSLVSCSFFILHYSLFHDPAYFSFFYCFHSLISFFFSIYSALVPCLFCQPEIWEVPLQIKSKALIRLTSCFEQWPVAINM